MKVFVSLVANKRFVSRVVSNIPARIGSISNRFSVEFLFISLLYYSILFTRVDIKRHRKIVPYPCIERVEKLQCCLSSSPISIVRL